MPPGPGPVGERRQSRVVAEQLGDELSQRVRRQVALGELQRGAGGRERARVVSLVIRRGGRQRHQDARLPPGAQLRHGHCAGARHNEVRRAVTTGADGTFTFEALPMGEWLAEVKARGHVTENFVVSIPHRGELRGVRVDLVPVRERVFQLYRRAAEPILPEPRLWGVWSPRQIVDHIRSKRPSPALADLTDFVEEVYFSPRLAAESILTGASERVDQAVRERTRHAMNA